MAISTKVDYANINDLFLDPNNPRLGHKIASRNLSQDEILESMKSWKLEELGVSYLQSGGFWAHEALLVINKPLYGENCLIVIEGNRRLAALKHLFAAYESPETSSKKWRDIASSKDRPIQLFSEIPYLHVDERSDVEAFLGFRHVTGIKEWNPSEKAEFISKLIDERKLTYEEVMRQIGSTTPAVRHNYITYRIFLQIENNIENISEDYFQKRFSVLYNTLKKIGVQQYLTIDVLATPEEAKEPVSRDFMPKLEFFASWLFGNNKMPPLFTDSRYVDDFGKLLESEKAVNYLEQSEKPNFDIAMRLSGNDQPEITRLIEEAATNIELSLSRIHFYKNSEKVINEVDRLTADVLQLLINFPDTKKKHFGNDK
jgi:hypothetical protein